jgi:glycosyltransferase involved in cell wall biosynthesis
MRILMVHNKYGVMSGEEVMIERVISLLRKNNHEVRSFFKDSAEIESMRFGKARSFFAGIYSVSSKKEIRHVLDEFKPDIVQIQNLFPLISPAILPVIRKRGVPIVMRCANFRLICPNGLFLSHGHLCEKCRGGNELWCAILNCENNILKSLGYTIRNYVARKCRFYTNNITLYIAQTEFQKKYLINENFSPERIVVIPNMIDDIKQMTDSILGHYVGYVGRISHEKGIQTLIDAAASCSQIRFKFAGDYSRMPQLVEQRPPNADPLGQLDSVAINNFYDDCRIVVLPSICYEGFPSVLIEAMIHGKPIICSRIGGLSEIVEDRITGLLFEPGNTEEFSEKIRYLLERPDLCREFGQAGREKALREYSPDRYYERLMAAYEKAKALAS